MSPCGPAHTFSTLQVPLTSPGQANKRVLAAFTPSPTSPHLPTGTLHHPGPGEQVPCSRQEVFTLYPHLATPLTQAPFTTLEQANKRVLTVFTLSHRSHSSPPSCTVRTFPHVPTLSFTQVPFTTLDKANKLPGLRRSPGMERSTAPTLQQKLTCEFMCWGQESITGEGGGGRGREGRG